MNPINVFKPKFRTTEILSEIKECLDNGWTGLGFKTVQFENDWKITGYIKQFKDICISLCVF